MLVRTIIGWLPLVANLAFLCWLYQVYQDNVAERRANLPVVDEHMRPDHPQKEYQDLRCNHPMFEAMKIDPQWHNVNDTYKHALFVKSLPYYKYEVSMKTPKLAKLAENTSKRLQALEDAQQKRADLELELKVENVKLLFGCIVGFIIDTLLYDVRHGGVMLDEVW